MFLLHQTVFNLLHVLHEQKTKPAVEIDSELHFMLDF